MAVSSSSSAYILQKGAEVMSMIKAPFKRKSMPPSNISVTPEKTPRSRRAVSATRSLNSLAASSVNSLSERDSDELVVSSTNPVVVIIDGEEVLIRDKDPSNTIAAAVAVLATTTNPGTIEVEDSEAFPEDELMNHSKNNLLTISEQNSVSPGADENKSVSDDDTNQAGTCLSAEDEAGRAKNEDQVPRSVRVARLKKKLKTKVLGLSNQLKETQQLSSENGNEMATKVKKYFTKVDTFENDKLISDDACSSKMNSPVHQASSYNTAHSPPSTSPSGAKRKLKLKKSRLRIKSQIDAEKIRSKDDHLIVESESGNKSIRNVIFSSFRNYTKSSGNTDDVQVAVAGKKEDPLESDYLQPIEVKQKAIKTKSTMKKNIKSKLKRFHIGHSSVDKLKTCKTCEKKCRKIHPSRTVLDFKREFKMDEMFESEFCTCTNSISIKNFNEEYFEEIDDDEDGDINIKNHLYSEIDGVSRREGGYYKKHCTGGGSE